MWGRVSTFYVGDVAAIAQGMLTCIKYIVKFHTFACNA